MPIIPYKKVKDIESRIQDLMSSATQEDLVFLVPTLQDRRALEDILSGGASFGRRPFRIWRWSDLYRNLLASIRQQGCSEKGRLQIDPPDHWLIIRHLVQKIIEHDEVGKLPGSILKQGFIPLAGETLKEMLREDISPEEIAEALGCGKCEGRESCSRLEEGEGLFCRLFHDYIFYLFESSDHPLMDSAQVATAVREMIEGYPEETGEALKDMHLVLTGFLSFNSSQLKLVRTLLKKVRKTTIFTPLTGTSRSYTLLEQLGDDMDIEDRPRQSALKGLILECADPRLEFETLARNLLLWREGKGPFSDASGGISFPGWGETGMTVSARSLDLAEEALTRYGIPHNLTEGRKVSETILWDLVQRIWNCYQSDWPGEETLRLLKEPFFAGPDGLHAIGSGSLPEGKREWLSILDEQSEAWRCINGMESFTSLLDGGNTPSNILGALFHLADSCKWGAKAASYTIGHPFLDERCRELNASIKELENKLFLIRDLESDAGPAGEEKLKGGHAFGFLRNWAESTTISRRMEFADSMEIHSGTPPVLSRKRIWIFTGTSSDEWPGMIRESPLLTDSRKEYLHEKKKLHQSHLPLLPEKRVQREVLFNRILACGRDLTILSHALSDLSGKPLKESPFIVKALEQGNEGIPWMENLNPDGARILQNPGNLFPLNEGPVIDGLEIHPSEPAWHELKGRELTTSKKGYQAPSSVSLSSLDDWLLCPYRYYCRHVLRMREKAGPGIDLALLGEGIHELWKRSWQVKGRDPVPVSRICNSLFEETLGTIYPSLFSDPELERHLSRIRFQVARLAELQDRMEDLHIRDERKTPLLEATLPSLEVEGIAFRGRADRIDLLEDGSCLILDYKSAPSYRYKGALQLAAYGLLIRQDNYSITGGSPLSGYGYLGLSDGKASGSFLSDKAREYLGISARTSPDLDQRLGETEECLNTMARSLIEGRFEPNYNSEACRYCSYFGICRRSEKPFTTVEEEEDDHEDR